MGTGVQAKNPIAVIHGAGAIEVNQRFVSSACPRAVRQNLEPTRFAGKAANNCRPGEGCCRATFKCQCRHGTVGRDQQNGRIHRKDPARLSRVHGNDRVRPQGGTTPVSPCRKQQERACGICVLVARSVEGRAPWNCIAKESFFAITTFHEFFTLLSTMSAPYFGRGCFYPSDNKCGGIFRVFLRRKPVLGLFNRGGVPNPKTWRLVRRKIRNRRGD